MSTSYNDDFKKQVVKEYMKGLKSTAKIAAEYNIAKSTVSQWAKKYSEEC
jgi:Transposase and inactivated derivatives